MIMISVRHRRDARAVKYIREHLLELLELGRHLLQQRVVLRMMTGGCRDDGRRGFDLPREEEHESLAPESAINHRFPIAGEAFVAAATCPNVRRTLRSLVVTQQLR